MFILIYKTIFCICLILIINFVLSKVKFLIDDPELEYHKHKHTNIIPLSGGIYFFLSIFFLSFLNDIDVKILIFLLPFLFVGIFADIKKEFSPKIRLIFQLFFFFVLVYFNHIKVTSVDLTLFDQILENKFFNLLFIIFCLITVLNGHNFMDGLNGFVIGNFILILSSILFVNLQLSTYSFDQIIIVQNLLVICSVFFLFNVFEKCFLGDNGIYIFSIFISLLIISFIENSNGLVSPLLGAVFLWYAAFENLFSILRRIKRNKTIYRADRLHLHILVKDFLNLKLKKKINSKKINTLSALILNIFLLPNFILGILWYNNSVKLLLLIIIQIILYIFLYNSLLKLRN